MFNFIWLKIIILPNLFSKWFACLCLEGESKVYLDNQTRESI